MMKIYIYMFLLLPFLILSKIGFLSAQVSDSCNCATIDFEIIPGDSVYNGLQINDQYSDSLGMTFILEDSTFPHIADVGGVKTSFESAWGNDTPAPGQNIGSFFLTDDGKTTGLSPSPLLIIFSIPVDSASGVVLDMDATESFSIQARGDTGQILVEFTIKSGDPGTGDGLATPWHFKRDTTDIYSIRLEGKRTQAGFFGLGFDNFTSCSSLRTTSVHNLSVPDSKPREFKLFQNYPNPFNPSTTITFTIPKTETVKLEVYNTLGQIVSNLVEDKLQAGSNEIEFNAGHLPSGVYFYRLQAGDYVDVKKMILLR